MKNEIYLTDAQLQAELDRCLYCSEKPCMEACPCDCSPADFIMAAKCGQPQDFERSAKEILKSNPLGQVCGITCPDTFCMQACSRGDFDRPINIPAVQASIVEKARKLDVLKTPEKPAKNGHKVAIVGAGPAGLAATATLARKGYEITIFEAAEKPGGACNLIPDERLPSEVFMKDYDFAVSLGHVEVKFGVTVNNAEELFENGYEAVLFATGEQSSVGLGVDGEENTVSFIEYLKNTDKYATKGNVAVVGGGAVAVDCAAKAKDKGAYAVEMFVRRTVGEMRITEAERQELLSRKIDITTRTRVEAIEAQGEKKALVTCKTAHVDGKLRDIEGTSIKRPDFDVVILAIGGRDLSEHSADERVFYAGDCALGGATVVEASASGKNMAAQIDALLMKKEKPAETKCESAKVTSKAKSRVHLENVATLPVSLETDFFGFKIDSPFLLSAAPHSDGFDQMKLAYEAGRAGGVMKTSFDDLPIHIPAGYMFAYTKDTYANCDNVSDHPINRVCKEVEQLRKLYPDRLTMASTGGPVTGHDEEDCKGWQSNTKKLEDAGCIGVEYSLSCPQGGDGTEGDIVSQNAAITAKVVEWILAGGNPDVPKLFKLTGAVTSVVPIVNAIKGVMAKYPNAKAGITLANSFPTLTFRPADKGNWEEGIIAGMSGEGVLPISYLSLANAGNLGVFISGNGGPMNYWHAANFLALGVKNVQFCSIAMKHGVHIIDDLKSGLSHMLKARGLKSVDELIGIALPSPVTDFMELTPEKQIPECDTDLCASCGNCTHCGYQAVSLDENKHPVFDASKCIGCSFCTKMCFTGALSLRDRKPEEQIAE